jgi:hypothetical protein
MLTAGAMLSIAPAALAVSTESIAADPASLPGLT